LTGLLRYESLSREWGNVNEAAMSLKWLVLIAGLTALSLVGTVPWTPTWAQTRAQTAQSAKPHRPMVRRARPYIVITPGQLLYRRCVEHLQLQNRQSGPVLYPLTYCWWVRG
jgi:hypothetical protein